MKWKRSRKAQQESKNKDSSNNDDKQSRSERSSSSNNQSSTYKNGNSEKVAASNNFHFPKAIDPNTQHQLPPHPAVLHQRHMNTLPGSSKDLMSNPGDENYTNLISRQSSFNETDDMIWRVV